MRSFDHVDNKVHEADFFLREIIAANGEMTRTRFLFSAFVASTRSITFALQAVMKGTPNFSKWYDEWQDKLKDNKLARFFHECRTDSQHIGFNQIMSGMMKDGQMLLFFGEPEHGRHKYIPEDDVLTACKKHMRKMCEIIDSAYETFGLEIDPDQLYTPEGLRIKNISLEDVEESLGLPRGYTIIPGKGDDLPEKRLKLLRRNIPGSHVKPVLKNYLQRKLTYPCAPFESIKQK